jgi:hypothetical protein
MNHVQFTRLLENAKRSNGYHFDPIKVGDFEISIQGNEGAYSTPRRKLGSLTDYEDVEIAIFFSKENGPSEWFLSGSDLLPELPHRDSFEGYCSDNDVAGYVDMHKVYEICRYLESAEAPEAFVVTTRMLNEHGDDFADKYLVYNSIHKMWQWSETQYTKMFTKEACGSAMRAMTEHVKSFGVQTVPEWDWKAISVDEIPEPRKYYPKAREHIPAKD